MIDKIVLSYVEIEELVETYKKGNKELQQRYDQLNNSHQIKSDELYEFASKCAKLEGLLASYRDLTEELITKYRGFLQDNDADWLADVTYLNQMVGLL